MRNTEDEEIEQIREQKREQLRERQATGESGAGTGTGTPDEPVSISGTAANTGSCWWTVTPTGVARAR